MPWVGPPPTNGGTLGIYRTLIYLPLPLVVTITGWGPNLTYASFLLVVCYLESKTFPELQNNKEQENNDKVEGDKGLCPGCFKQP